MRSTGTSFVSMYSACLIDTGMVISGEELEDNRLFSSQRLLTLLTIAW